MIKSGIDQDAMVAMFSEATAKQGEAVRKAVAEATLKALQGRELTLENIRKVLKSMTQSATLGASRNPAAGIDAEALLGKAFEGMDAALLQAVEANRKALEQFVERGVGLQDKQMRSALANVEKMEDVFFTTVAKAAQAASTPLQGPWQQVLDGMKIKGTDTGAQANATIEQLMQQAQSTLREGRASGVRAAEAMMNSYAALVSGVLIGMSEGLKRAQGGESEETQAEPSARPRRK